MMGWFLAVGWILWKLDAPWYVWAADLALGVVVVVIGEIL